MKCFSCDNEMIHGETEVKGHIQGGEVYFQHVPALVCPNELCKEEVLLGSTVDRIEQAIEEIKQGKRESSIVMDFSQFE